MFTESQILLVIVDEFSMVKADTLYQIDARLQEIKNSDSNFGGTCLLFFGDPLQLKPVLGRYPWQEPLKYKDAHAALDLWSLFKPVMLTKNHRQNADREYGELLSRLRINQCTKEDLSILQTRVVPNGSKKIPNGSIYLFSRNADVNDRNEACLEEIESDEIEVKTIFKHPTKKDYEGPSHIDPTGNVPNTNLQKIFKFKIGCQIMLTYNINTVDCLVNGAIGVIVGVTYNSRGQPNDIHVSFSNPSHGLETAKKFPDLEEKYGVPVVPIKRFETLFRISKENFGAKATATAIQYPLKLAFSVTSHKVS